MHSPRSVLDAGDCSQLRTSPGLTLKRKKVSPTKVMHSLRFVAIEHLASVGHKGLDTHSPLG